MPSARNQPLQRAPAAEDAAEAAYASRARLLPHTQRRRWSRYTADTAAPLLRRCGHVWVRRRARALSAASAASPAAGAPPLSHGVVLCPASSDVGRATHSAHCLQPTPKTIKLKPWHCQSVVIRQVHFSTISWLNHQKVTLSAVGPDAAAAVVSICRLMKAEWLLVEALCALSAYLVEVDFFK